MTSAPRHGRLGRRDFHRLAGAAIAGLVAGTSGGCERDRAETADSRDASGDVHICRGLNTCAGKGKNGDNACAGRGTCATAEPHACTGLNSCKGLGGCGQNPGQNACKGQGACAVPLSEETWPKARAHFENVMAERGKDVGPAPPR